MPAVSSLFLVRRLCVFAALAMLAACATPGGQGPSSGGGSPHYKVGAPYKVNGRWYKPEADADYEKTGIASWYGDQFNGKRTANGEIFDKNRLSAAHTTLPLPSLVEVKNLENGRKVIVRVNDRGPFVDNRLIDLSHAAAKELGFESKGLAKVKVRYIGRADLHAKAEAPGARRSKTKRLAAKTRKAPPAPIAVAAAPATPPQPVQRSAPAQDEEDQLARLIGEALAAAPAKPSEYWIAVGAFDTLNALEAAKFTLPSIGQTRIVTTPSADGAIEYELQIGPDFDEDSAGARLAALREAGYSDARIVDGAL